MRTTLTLEQDLYTQLQTLARQSGLSFKELVNRTLRKGLAKGAEPAEPRPRFVVKPFSLELRPGIDPNRLNQLYDELEIEDFLRKEAQQE